MDEGENREPLIRDDHPGREKVKRSLLPIGPVLLLLCFFGALGTVQATEKGFPGALVIKSGKPVPFQKSADEVRPFPGQAESDRGQLFLDGCFVKGSEIDSPECEYGDLTSAKDVVLFGDSRAAQFFPALQALAVQREWRLTVLTRGLCSFAEISQSKICSRWRKRAISRIESIAPEMVIVGTSPEYFRSLGGKSAIPALVKDTRRTFAKLKRTGAVPILMRGQSMSPYFEPEIPANCIKRHLDDLARCAWAPGKRKGREFDFYAARKESVKVIDTEARVCRPTVCPSVIGNVITHRDGQHYSATFAETLAPWLGKQLPGLR